MSTAPPMSAAENALLQTARLLDRGVHELSRGKRAPLFCLKFKFGISCHRVWHRVGRVCRKPPIHPPTAEKHLYCRQARWLTRVVKTLLKIIVQRRGRTTSTKITKQLSDVGRQPQAAQITSKSKSWWEEEKYKSMIRCDPPPLGMGGRLQCEKVECVILVISLCCLDNWSNLMRQTNQSAPGPPSRSVKTIPRPENLKIIWKSFSCNSSSQNQQCLSADAQTFP